MSDHRKLTLASVSCCAYGACAVEGSFTAHLQAGAIVGTWGATTGVVVELLLWMARRVRHEHSAKYQHSQYQTSIQSVQDIKTVSTRHQNSQCKISTQLVQDINTVSTRHQYSQYKTSIQSVQDIKTVSVKYQHS